MYKRQTLLLAQGVPMIAHGDELGRTQQGNNNVYCQDNALSWVDWDLAEDQAELLTFTQRVVRLRREHPVFRRRRFFAGSADHGGESDIGDIAWFRPDGAHMDEASWATGFAKSVMVFLNGSAIPETDTRGNPIVDDSFLLLFNAHYEDIDFVLPEEIYGLEWTSVIDTATPDVTPVPLGAGATVRAGARSIMVLRTERAKLHR